MEARQKQFDTQQKLNEHLEALLKQRDQQHQRQFEEILHHLLLSQVSFLFLLYDVYMMDLFFFFMLILYFCNEHIIRLILYMII